MHRIKYFEVDYSTAQELRRRKLSYHKRAELDKRLSPKDLKILVGL